MPNDSDCPPVAAILVTLYILTRTPQLPEILFGNNALELHHEPTGFLLQFEARGALEGWVKLFAKGTFEVCFVLCSVVPSRVLAGHDMWFL